LLVDDSDAACEFMKRFLEKRGHEVCIAHNGRGALLVVQEFHPDVVLLDIRLPDMSGYEVMQELKKTKAARGATFVAVSGYPEGNSREPMEFDHFLQKPLDMAHLETLLRAKSLPPRV